MRWIGIVLTLSLAASADPPAPGQIAALVAQLGSDDPAVRDRAENDLLEIGQPAVEPLEKALEGADPDLKLRIESILPWIRPGWDFNPMEKARDWFASWVAGRNAEDSVSRPLEAMDLDDPALATHYRLFSGRSARGSEATIAVGRTGTCGFLGEADFTVVEMLRRSGIRARGEAGVQRVGRIAYALPDRRVPQEARIEVDGRTWIYHAHILIYRSGEGPVYLEDTVFRFDESGVLAESSETGYDDLPPEVEKKLFDDADPWLLVFGFVDDRVLKDLRERQAKKEKTPPRHPRGK